MRPRFGIFFGALALLQILGGHWALLRNEANTGPTEEEAATY
jgi:hypothetical protein